MMALPDLFSRRKREAAGKGVDVYSYDELPEKLKVQIIHVLKDSIGEYFPYHDGSREVYAYATDTLRKEFGVFRLDLGYGDDRSVELFSWFLSNSDVDEQLDFIELMIRLLDTYVRENFYKFRGVVKQAPDDAIAEINARMREAGFGYSYESPQLIRVDSQVAHAEIVVPALRLLSDAQFSSAEKEYRAAHAAYRGSKFETAIVECGKAFESALKVIAEKRSWGTSPNDPAKKLLDAAYASGFIESSLQAEFTALRSLLEAGVPTVRNRQGGHGAGVEARRVPQELSAFQLHQTAAAIIFLVEHDKAIP